VAAVLALVGVAGLLVGPRIVQAFTLPPNIIYFDPVSVPAGHTLHVHLFNELGNFSMDFRPFVRPTTAAVGSPVVGATVSLAPGDGSDQDFAFASFAPPAGVTRAPVVVTILVTRTGGGALGGDWSGRVASSVEVIDDATGQQVAILGGRHITRGPGMPNPCLSCN
jgi:hypothetical protein